MSAAARALPEAVARSLDFHDPADTLAYIDPDEFPVDEHGVPNAAEIVDRVEQLAAEKPYLVRRPPVRIAHPLREASS